MGYQALLFCPDEKAARGVTQVLSELDFTVEPCTEPFAAVKKLMAQHFDAIVVDCDNEQNATLLFKSARNSSSNQSSLAVAVVEGQAGVAKAFRIGANLVLTKPINIEQAKGTLRVARGLLRKGGDVAPKPAAEHTTTPVGAPVSSIPSAPTATAPKPAASAPRPAQPTAATPAPAAAKAWPSPPKKVAPARSPQTDDSRPGTSPATAADASPKVTGSPKIDASSKVTKPTATSTQPTTAPQTKYPWQASKPGAEPMASALKKAAEAAGIAAPPAPQSSSAEAPQIKSAASPTMVGSAAAPAPAKEKVQMPAPAPAPSPSSEKTATVEPKEPVPSHLPEPVEKTFAEATHAPSFSMGAPAVDEEEPGNSKKAIIILAIVVVLASLAGYLGWKNMSGKTPAATPAPQVQTPPASPAQSPSSALPSPSDSTTVSAIAPASAGTTSEPVTAQPAKPSAKVIAKDTTRPVAPASASPAEAQPSAPAPALVVHNETSKPATKPSAPDADSAPAPSALGLTSNPDPNALSAIGNAPVAVPKASAQVVKLSQGVSEGLILKKVSPHYPAQALQMHIEGSVQMQATIGKDGSISNLKILGGDPLLAHSAQEAVKQWKYKPYYLDGEPVDVQTQITINFKLPK
jgi:periplasmic protein TonB